MIEILRPTKDGLQRLEKIERDCWVNVVSPTPEELTLIRSMLDIPEETMSALQDIDEVPALEHYEKFTSIIIRAPFDKPNDDLEYATVPVGIFSTNHFVLTISFFENDTLENLKKQKFTFRKTQLLFKLLLISSKLYLSYLVKLKNMMYTIESQLAYTQKNEVIMKYLKLQKSLVYFDTSLQANNILIQRIAEEGEGKEITRYGIVIRTREDKELIRKVIDENNQAIHMIEIYSNILSNTMDAFTSIISNNLNVVIKILTSVTIVLAFPTMVASIYGMNIELPFQHSPQAFTIVMGLSFLLSVISIWTLWKLDYF
jgi:magnesium transporter